MPWARFKVGERYVMFIKENGLVMTDDPKEAAHFTLEKAMEAEEQIRKFAKDTERAVH